MNASPAVADGVVYAGGSRRASTPSTLPRAANLELSPRRVCSTPPQSSSMAWSMSAAPGATSTPSMPPPANRPGPARSTPMSSPLRQWPMASSISASAAHSMRSATRRPPCRPPPYGQDRHQRGSHRHGGSEKHGHRQAQATATARRMNTRQQLQWQPSPPPLRRTSRQPPPPRWPEPPPQSKHKPWPPPKRSSSSGRTISGLKSATSSPRNDRGNPRDVPPRSWRTWWRWRLDDSHRVVPRLRISHCYCGRLGVGGSDATDLSLETRRRHRHGDHERGPHPLGLGIPQGSRGSITIMPASRWNAAVGAKRFAI